MRILGIADHPWQTQVLSDTLLSLRTCIPELIGEIALADYYTPYHAPDFLSDCIEKYPWTYHHVGDLYEIWQTNHSHKNLSDSYCFVRDWTRENFNSEDFRAILKTNQYINSYERSRYIQRTPECCQIMILADTIRWAEDIFNSKVFDFIIGIERYTMLVAIFQAIALRKKITYLKILPSRIENRWLVTNQSGVGMDSKTSSYINSTSISEHCRREAMIFADRLKTGQSGLYARWLSGNYVYSRKNDFHLGNEKVEVFGKRWKLVLATLKVIVSRHLIHYRRLKFRSRILDEKPITLSLLEVSVLGKKLLRSVGLCLWGESSPNLDAPFYLWCLHFRPEGSTLVLSEGVDEIQVILDVVAQVPDGAFLYVKENPLMFGWRQGSFIKLLRSNPKILLVDAFFPTHKLVDHALGVIGLSGTVLLEALAFGKKSISLGKPEFDLMLPYKGYSQLEEFFAAIETPKEILENFIKYYCYVVNNATENCAPENTDSKSLEYQDLISELTRKIRSFLSI